VVRQPDGRNPHRLLEPQSLAGRGHPGGPNNAIQPGGPDRGQPTHFLAGRQTGTFLITVPKTFTEREALTWTLTINGQTNSIPLKLNPTYNVSPLKDSSVANTPPTIRFLETGPSIQGPMGTLAKAVARTTTVGPIELTVWAGDDAKLTEQLEPADARAAAAGVVHLVEVRGPASSPSTSRSRRSIG
jgi:hypothetical protein